MAGTLDDILPLGDLDSVSALTARFHSSAVSSPSLEDEKPRSRRDLALLFASM